MRGTSEPPKGNPRPSGRGGGQIEEAEELSNRVAIIDYGEIKALGSPRSSRLSLEERLLS
jgi:hypothetical protein